MTSKEKYTRFCSEHEPVIPVFLQPFWLDTVAEKWDVVLVEHSEKLIAALPFCLKGNFITQRIYLPTLSFYQSFILTESVKQKDIGGIVTQLMNGLPKTVKSYFKLLPQYSFLSLEKMGYSKEAYTTYILHNEKEANSNLRKNHQRNIEKAGKLNYRIADSSSINKSYELLVSTFKKQRKKPPVELHMLKNIIEVLNNNNAGSILDCIDENGILLASIFIVKDKMSYYYLLGGYNELQKNSGAMTYLLWHCIQQAKEESLEFNFCGSTKKSIANYFEGFGAIPQAIAIWKKSLF